jgi:hypothetical protein
MIKIFPATIEGQTEAMLVPDPKNVIFNGTEFVVKTESDFEPDPTQY